MPTKDPEVSKIANLVPYQITRGDNGDAWVKVWCWVYVAIQFKIVPHRSLAVMAEPPFLPPSLSVCLSVCLFQVSISSLLIYADTTHTHTHA